MANYPVILSDEHRARLEDLRRAYGDRSCSETVRRLIDGAVFPGAAMVVPEPVVVRGSTVAERMAALTKKGGE